jgi:hypothetical protein
MAVTLMPSVSAKKHSQSTPAPSPDPFKDVTLADILVLSNNDLSDTEPGLYRTHKESNNNITDEMVDSEEVSLPFFCLSFLPGHFHCI